MPEQSLTVRQVDASEYADALTELEDLLEPSVSFLQAPMYGRLQEHSDKTVVYFIAYGTDKHTVACGIAIRYTAPWGMNFLYCPYGPVAISWSSELTAALRHFFKPIARRLQCAFVRLDHITAAHTDTTIVPITDRLARTASLQPRAEWLLDISKLEDELWMGFHKHARYNIRLAERAQADVKFFTPAQAPLDDFFRLMKTTADRDGFSIFDRSYYKAYLQAMTPADGFMIICYIDGTPAAAGLFVTHDAQAHYVFAGSSDDYRKIAPAYSVIWSAIKKSRERGCLIFNFGGVTEAVKGQKLIGVSGFKRRFGGSQVDHPNPGDLVYDRPRYVLFKLYKYLVSK